MALDLLTVGWWCRDLDEKEYGPFPLKTMREYLAGGVIVPDTQVRHNFDDTWRAAGDVEELTRGLEMGRGGTFQKEGMPRKKADRMKAAEGDLPCVKHHNHRAVTVCYRCHAPACPRCIYRPEHWMCKSCHSFVYNRRTFAGLVDYFLIPLFILMFTQLVFSAMGVKQGETAFLGGGLFASFNVASWIVLIIYYLFKDSLPNGRSLGKLLCGIRVADLSTGQPCSPIQSIKRNALLGVNWLPFIGWIFGLWWLVDVSRAWYDARGLRAFDRWAGTTVGDIPAGLEKARARAQERIQKMEAETAGR